MAIVAANNLDWQYSKTTICERFKTLHHLSKWTDCTFIVGVNEKLKVINCHKLVLAASSPVFEALFYGLLATSDCDRPIIVPDMEPQTFHSMLQYLYEDDICFSSVEEAGNVLYAAKKYLLPHLSLLCIKYLEKNLRANTLWDVLAIAEALNDETLLNACVKEMCKYSKDVWWMDGEHMSLETLHRFLKEPLIQMDEKKIFEIIIAWAEFECSLQDVPSSISNVRAVIDKFNLLSKVRVLTLSSSDLEEIQNKSNIFSNEELKIIRDYIKIKEVPESIKNYNSLEKIRSRISSLPISFCTSTEKRSSFIFSYKKCARAIMSKKNIWTYGGSMLSIVSSSSKVLVSGFEVFTRLASQIDFIINHGLANTYKEQLVVSIENETGEEVSLTKYEKMVEYNSSQIINLSQPIWFLPKAKYTVKIELPSGQYPLSNLSKIAYSKVAHFNFSDCVRYQDRYFGDHEVLDAGFISAVMYSV